MNSTRTDSVWQINKLEFGNLNYTAQGEPTVGYFETISNVTMATVAPNFRGLGLPLEQYQSFADLLYNISSAVECLDDEGGYCIMMQPCDEVSNLVWNMQFRISFEGADNYLVVPLSTFSWGVSTHCFLQVEPLQTPTETPNM